MQNDWQRAQHEEISKNTHINYSDNMEVYQAYNLML